VNWYKKHFRNEEPDFQTGEPETLPENELWCTPNGQILALYPNSKTVFDLNKAMLPDEKPIELKTPDDINKRKNEMRNAVEPCSYVLKNPSKLNLLSDY